MIEMRGDLWTYPAEAIVVPINWRTRADESAVMGAGVAKQAADRYRGLAIHVGEFIARNPTPCAFTLPTWDGLVPLIAVPTKRDWRKPSSLGLIELAARGLPEIVGDWQTIALPRLGCGLGGLRWEDVRPVLAAHLDDRFVVVAP